MIERVPRARLSGRAAQFLQILRDFGHLDEAECDRLAVAACDAIGGQDEVVDLVTVRRLAAMMLGSGRADHAENAVLKEDWPVLFS